MSCCAGLKAAGQPSRPRRDKGFGTRVMEAMIRDQLGGDLRLDWRPDGLVCEIIITA
jgi:two-component sensor histidine kinase